MTTNTNSSSWWIVNTGVRGIVKYQELGKESCAEDEGLLIGQQLIAANGRHWLTVWVVSCECSFRVVSCEFELWVVSLVVNYVKRISGTTRRGKRKRVRDFWPDFWKNFSKPPILLLHNVAMVLLHDPARTRETLRIICFSKSCLSDLPRTQMSDQWHLRERQSPHQKRSDSL